METSNSSSPSKKKGNSKKKKGNSNNSSNSSGSGQRDSADVSTPRQGNDNKVLNGTTTTTTTKQQVLAETTANGDDDVERLSQEKKEHESGIAPTGDNPDIPKDVAEGLLQKELQKEKQRSQELEKQLGSFKNEMRQQLRGVKTDLENQLATKGKVMEDAAAAVREELLNEKARSQQLEQHAQSLKSELDETLKSATGNDRAVQDELEKEKAKSKRLEEQLSSLTTGEISRDNEVDELRRSLEQEKASRSEAENKLSQTEQEKANLEAKYENLLGRLSTIKSTVGERMKANAEELEQTRNMVEDLESQNHELNLTVDHLRSEISNLQGNADTSSNELSSLRNRLNISQQNWTKEREDLINAERFSHEEYEAAKQAMQEWEVIAIEESSIRKSLGDRVVELEEQLATVKASYEKAASERDSESLAVNGLQRALQDIQDARKQELREVVESMQTQIDQLKAKSEAAEKRAVEAEAQLSTVQADLSRVLPFEKEVKEKNLLIGKLRHEAVTLNDHLRKALRMLKRDNAEDKVDKQLVTNYFLSFVTSERGDAKKYEMLQLIASVLDWSDEQREKAGLVRPGTAARELVSSLKTPPLSPFHRSPSTPSLSDAYEGSRDLWTSIFSSDKS